MTRPDKPGPKPENRDDYPAFLDRVPRYRLGSLEPTASAGLGRLAVRTVPAGVLVLAAFLGIANTAGIPYPAAFSAAVAVCALLTLFVRSAEPIGEWSVVLADRGQAAESVYTFLAGSLREKNLPVDRISTRRIEDGFATVNYLDLVDHDYRAVISVFRYGDGLYVGWTMSRSRRGWKLLLDRARRADDFARAASARAMRETVHAICVEGLRIAIGRVDVPTAYGFPHGAPPIEVPREQAEDNWAVAIYLRDGGVREGEEIRKAVERFWAELGFEVVAEFDPVLGSFFQKLRAKAASPQGRAALQERLEKLERAAEVQLLAVPESQATLNNAQGLAALIQALEKESAAAIQLGPLLLIKTCRPDGASQVYSCTLTPAQLKHLERHPELLKDPGGLQAALDAAGHED